MTKQDLRVIENQKTKKDVNKRRQSDCLTNPITKKFSNFSKFQKENKFSVVDAFKG